jgi:hypothetical protein
VSRDPFSRAAELGELGRAVLLEHASVTIDVRGVRVQVVGADPRRDRRDASSVAALSDPEVPLRILLSHFPSVAAHLPAGAFQLVLAGHMHAGQICIPYPGGRLPLAHPRARVVKGVYRRAGTVLHVSPGLGTTFVPFRLFARPEVTELVLRVPR